MDIFEKIGEGISFAIIITSNILSKLFKKIQKLNFQSCILLVFIIVTIIMILIFIAYFIISFMGV